MIEIHPTNKNEVAWTSWLPALGFALARSTGPVLELGSGHFSTSFLWNYCKGANRYFSSFEENDKWLKQFKHLDCKEGRIVGVTDYTLAVKTTVDHFLRNQLRIGVAFIDNSPGGAARSEPFKLLLPCCDFIVVHDYHRENEEAIKPLLDGVNCRVFSDYEPPTLLASALHPVQ